eukprot:maker-scaffold_68-snap-gene-0.99-mRNA-1 protein AED:0.02 eAED:0.02 QI:80/1/1/1/0.8/0.66/6/36/850
MKVVRRLFSTTSNVDKVARSHILPTYSATGSRLSDDLLLTHGKGVRIFAESHQTPYLDFGAGIAVSILGHGDEKISKAISDQSMKLLHTSNLYHTQPALTVAEQLTKMSPGYTKVFFTNSGTESNEGAIKFAALANPGREYSLSFKGSFHGRSLGSLRSTFKPKIREPFNNLLKQTNLFADINDIKQLEKVFKDHGKDLMYVIIEPVQGEGGVRPCDYEFLRAVRKLCDEYEVCLIFDEVQIGLGRAGSGYLWGHEAYGIKGDIVTTAKPIAAGLPMGTILVSEHFEKKFLTADKVLGKHGTTFGGNPVCCAAAEVVLKELSDPKFISHIEDSGEAFISSLKELQQKFPDLIETVSHPLGGKALYAGLKLKDLAASAVVQEAFKNNLLVITAGDDDSVIRLCPPLIISKEEIEEGVQILHSVFATLRAENNLSEQAKLPAGFSSSTVKFQFSPEELGDGSKAEMCSNLVVLDKSSSSTAAVFTKNLFCGAPVKVGKKIIQENKPIKAILVNNKVSNVHPRNGGIDDIEELCDELKKLLGSDDEIFPSSTGVIGWRLPVVEFKSTLPTNVKNLDGSNGREFAKGIMTTDRYPKAFSEEIIIDGINCGRITGFAKGAGMIEPNMATMLVFLFSDVDTRKFTSSLQNMLVNAINAPGSLNRISIDAAQSTSDTVLLVSSDKVNVPESVDTKAMENKFYMSLQQICSKLAEEVVRNGEGVEHVIKVRITGGGSQTEVVGVGREIVNSPLVKTAIAGNDPNVGRILGAIGDYYSKVDLGNENFKENLKISLGGRLVFEKEEFMLDSESERMLAEYFKKSESVEIEVFLGKGAANTEIIGADLTHGYVTENATYRS